MGHCSLFLLDVCYFLQILFFSGFPILRNLIFLTDFNFQKQCRPQGCNRFNCNGPIPVRCLKVDFLMVVCNEIYHALSILRGSCLALLCLRKNTNIYQNFWSCNVKQFVFIFLSAKDCAIFLLLKSRNSNAVYTKHQKVRILNSAEIYIIDFFS